jgi:Asp-tRNA(Asn)/Glu-tRNA(Gln) amidotransferase A subunit family amidase
MGVGMQFAYMGFVGTPEIEAEASVQLVRIDRFARRVAGCHLALQALRNRDGSRSYDARLDLITRDYNLIPIEHVTDSDAQEAIRAAFDAAVRLLEKDGATVGASLGDKK